MSVRNRQPWRPDWVVLPGEVIAEKLTELGWTQKRLAAETGYQQPYVSDIMRGGRGISVAIALRLESVLGISAEIWLGLQTAYDLAIARGPAAAPADHFHHFVRGKCSCGLVSDVDARLSGDT